MYNIGIIGAGPAGYTAAIRAAQYGLKVVLFEKKDIGGTCLNQGCIPTKTILHSTEVYANVKSSAKAGIIAENISFDYSKIFERKNNVVQKIRKSLTQLITSYGIEIINGEANLIDGRSIEANGQVYECEKIIISTGSRPNRIEFNGNYDKSIILDSDDILGLEVIPKNILIVGSGAIGIEWARIFSELDKKITIVEIAKNLIPLADIDVSSRIERIFKRNKISYFTETSIKEINGNKVILSNDKEIETDCILLATGRSPVIPHINGLNKDKFVITDNNFETNIKNVFAIGDINGKSMLAHSAIHQAVEVVEFIKNKKEGKFSKNNVPSVIYGSPEIAWIGQTEQELSNNNVTFKKSMFPIAALGKAYADDKIEGFIKILATDNEILGAHIISQEASSMIQQIAIARENNLPPKELEKVIFAHPTYSEGIYEAILGLDNLALHLPQQK